MKSNPTKNVPATIGDVIVNINGQNYKLVPVDTSHLGQHENTMPLSRKTPLVPFVRRLVQELRTYGRNRTAETYCCAINSLLRFLPDKVISISDIDVGLMIRYERYLRERGLSSNTTSFYMRVLRTIYNRAVREGLVTNDQPFSRVYTGIGRTNKRALPLSVIQQIYNLQVLSPAHRFARDIFLFSFYTRGMAFIDIAYLKPSNIRNNTLIYRRHKTGQQLAIRWEPQMQDIVMRHPSSNPDYLLPIIKRSNGCERSQYRACQRQVNELLRDIGQQLHLQQQLTFYVARHSWASIARSMDIPLPIISEGMGHDSERTTQIYLKSLDFNRIDSINASIISAVEEQNNDV